VIKSNITDGAGTGQQASVLSEGELLVSQHSSPPLLPQKCRVFSQFLTVDGTSAASNDLGVSGAVTPVEYWVPAAEDADRYITKLSFVVGYASAAYIWEFADLNAALTNGVKIYYTDSNREEVTIANPTRNSSFLRLGLSSGIIPTAWELRHLGATNDYGFLTATNLSEFMPPYGIKLDMGTNQRLSILIRDDCTSAVTFNCRAFGFERLP